MALRTHNTFGFTAFAAQGAVVRAEADLLAILSDPRVAGRERLVIGGGSNLVLTGDFDGLALLMAIPGRKIVRETDEAVWVEAGAGEPWHAFVEWTVRHGLPGLENLALIPGTVGASPVQNIGAYGLELAERFDSLRAFDTETATFRHFDRAACAFGYRDSVFKQYGKQYDGRRERAGGVSRYIITSVTFRLPRPWQPVASYADVARVLADKGIVAPTASDIFDAVVAIRRTKLPDPAQIGNAGSFFKNPVVDAAHYQTLRAAEPELVAYAQPDGRFKLAAGWMIDRCGWKGRTLGNAAVHERQALVLVNPGQATGSDVLALAQAIAADVRRRFGVTLEMEPRIV